MPEHLAPKLINWASILEDKTREQAITASSMPFIHPHLALMPDAHLGKGATVGSVIPTLGAIMPAAVGVDIGCGMMAVRTQWTKADVATQRLADLHRSISGRIPLSAGGRNQKLSLSVESRVRDLIWTPGADQADEVLPTWSYQLGTLGSGNHFLEASYDEEDRVWLFLHSGSRGVGNKIAQRHIQAAQDYCARHYISLPDRDLAYLVEGTEEFDSYIAGLRWAQKFALLNREEMMDRMVAAVEEFMGEPLERLDVVNTHHNFTEHERHFGKDVWLSRKGAISAKTGERGLIPGSMGDLSYVVVGLGNRLALESAPHGAGRQFSRGVAKRTFTREDLDARMEAAGVTWGNSDAFLDEHPSAYKPIDVVMDDAKDLVAVQHTLRQFLNVKGD